MAVSKRLETFLAATTIADKFQPYHELNLETDTLTFYFRGDADYSKRLSDHVTLYLSVDKDELVGCRIKGISGILEDLPNYIDVTGDDGELQLSLVFLPFRGEVKQSEQRVLANLAKQARGQTIPRHLKPCGAS